MVNLDELTELQDPSIFRFVREPSQPEERIPSLIVLISFEMDLNLYNVERSGYNILDLLSNIGGILGMLISIANVFNHIFNYNNFDDFLVA